MVKKLKKGKPHQRLLSTFNEASSKKEGRKSRICKECLLECKEAIY
jgi:hypothetical protein